MASRRPLLQLSNLASAFSASARQSRWICPTCKSRIRQFTPTSTGRRSFTAASRRLDDNKSLATTNKQTEPSEPSPLPTPIDEKDLVETKGSAYDPDVYEPASTWDGLDRVGGKAWREKQKTAKPFNGFLLDAKSSYEDPSIAIRRAVVEALAMRASGSQDITEFEGLGEKSDKAQITVAQDAQSVSLSIMRDDGKKLSYEAIPISSGALVDMENASQTSNLGSSSDKDPESDMQKGQSWADVPLRDPSFKFTIVKRVMQLTGKRITDPIIQQSSTADELCNNLLTKPKPKKLYETLHDDEELHGLVNVKIHKRRVTPIDKDKKVGRWKVIEQELFDRNLPVTGHDPNET